MLINTSTLTGIQLDWAVALCEEMDYSQGMPEIEKDVYGHIWLYLPIAFNEDHRTVYSPSNDWAQGGPIIDAQGISVQKFDGSSPPDRMWNAYIDTPPLTVDEEMVGDTPLIAAMRSYVKFNFGDTVEIPEELL